MKKNDTDYLKGVVYAHLSVDNPKTQAELEHETGIDRRDVRRLVREMRIDGLKICSGREGFWIWNGCDASWERTKAQIIKKAAHTFELANAIKAREKMEGQMSWEVSA